VVVLFAVVSCYCSAKKVVRPRKASTEERSWRFFSLVQYSAKESSTKKPWNNEVKRARQDSSSTRMGNEINEYLDN
jgi:hypothetical protein